MDYISKIIANNNLKLGPPILGDVSSISTKVYYLEPCRKEVIVKNTKMTCLKLDLG
jgi:hypothetical protein